MTLEQAAEVFAKEMSSDNIAQSYMQEAFKFGALWQKLNDESIISDKDAIIKRLGWHDFTEERPEIGSTIIHKHKDEYSGSWAYQIIVFDVTAARTAPDGYEWKYID